MKFCSKCGKEIMEEAVICPHCGCTTERGEIAKEIASRKSSLVTAIKVLMIIGGILTSIAGYGIPLLWCIPMTVSYFKKADRGENISTGFKVCTILFTSSIAGILMFCDKE